MAGTPWHRIALGALAAVATAAVLAVATDERPPDPVRPRPVAPLLTDGPVWTRIGTPVSTPGSPSARGGLVLLQRAEGRGELILVDLETGVLRWSLPFGAPLSGGADRYAGGAILIGNGVLVRTRTGIALLSAAAGRMLWRTPIRSGPGERHVLAAADDETALVTVFPTRGGVPRVVAVDLSAGAPRWARAALSPYGLVADVVVGVTAPRGTVAAWDAATGAPRWVLTGLASARVALMADDDVLVEGRTAAGEPVRWLLEAGTGERLAEFGDPRGGGCATDGVTLIACPRDGTFETWGVADRQRRTVSGDFRPEVACLVGPDHIFAAGARSYFAAGRGGTLADPALPGRPVAVSEGHLLLRTDTGNPPLTSAYRLPSGPARAGR